MHSYLRAVGFSKIKDGIEIKELLHEVFYESDKRDAVKVDKGNAFVEYCKEFAPGMGIVVCGNIDREGFHQEYYYPYLEGTSVTTKEEVLVEKRSDSESYSGICEDMRVGVSLIFYLRNAVQYKKRNLYGRLFDPELTTTLSGLSVEGRILLPVIKDEENNSKKREEAMKRNRLIAEARQGNEEAMESLTLEDIDMYASVVRRVQREDIFSIVESYFMPYGSECDLYQIMGEILHVKKVENEYTGEKIYQMGIMCNDLKFDICINKKDLLGDPDVGRRFRGTIWMQGKINFSQ